MARELGTLQSGRELGNIDDSPNTTISLGGVTLNANPQSKYFQPTKTGSSVVDAVAGFGTGAGKVTAEAVRGLGQLGTSIQSGINSATGLNLPTTKVYDDGGTFDTATTPIDTAQKIGYGAGSIAQLVTPIGKGKGASSIVSDTAKVAAGTTKALASVTTGIPKEVLTRASSPDYALKIEQAVSHITENPKQPFLQVAHKTGEAIKGAESSATSNLTTAIDNFRKYQGNKTFNVQSKYPEIVKALDGFKSSGLTVNIAKDKLGKFSNIAIQKSTQSPFADQEVKHLNELLGSIRSSDNVNIDNLLALRKKLSAAYDAVPLGVNGTPRPYHAAVMALKGTTEKAIDELLPKELKDANKQYKAVMDMKDAFGNRIVDAQGSIKDSAEQFLANISNINKGELRKSIDQFRSLTGVDLTQEVQVIKDAEKLSPLFASTGSRNQDILRAAVTIGLGSGTGGIGSAVGLAATSPRVIGKVATTVGKTKNLLRNLLQGKKK